jgi:hypothetical protein
VRSGILASLVSHVRVSLFTNNYWSHNYVTVLAGFIDVLFTSRSCKPLQNTNIDTDCPVHIAAIMADAPPPAKRAK